MLAAGQSGMSLHPRSVMCSCARRAGAVPLWGSTPQWQDNSDSALNQGHLDGDAEDWDDDPADHQYPVCYESGSNLKVTVMFLADPQEDFEDATIEGDGPEGLDFSAEEADFVTIGDKDYARVEFESSAAFLASKVDWFPGWRSSGR